MTVKYLLVDPNNAGGQVVLSTATNIKEAVRKQLSLGNNPSIYRLVDWDIREKV